MKRKLQTVVTAVEVIMKNNKKSKTLATVLSCTFVVAAYLIADSAMAAEASTVNIEQIKNKTPLASLENTNTSPALI
jgi:hypothetical protein